MHLVLHLVIKQIMLVIIIMTQLIMEMECTMTIVVTISLMWMVIIQILTMENSKIINMSIIEIKLMFLVTMVEQDNSNLMIIFSRSSLTWGRFPNSKTRCQTQLPNSTISTQITIQMVASMKSKLMINSNNMDTSSKEVHQNMVNKHL